MQFCPSVNCPGFTVHIRSFGKQHKITELKVDAHLQLCKANPGFCSASAALLHDPSLVQDALSSPQLAAPIGGKSIYLGGPSLSMPFTC